MAFVVSRGSQLTLLRKYWFLVSLGHISNLALTQREKVLIFGDRPTEGHCIIIYNHHDWHLNRHHHQRHHHHHHQVWHLHWGFHHNQQKRCQRGVPQGGEEKQEKRLSRKTTMMHFSNYQVVGCCPFRLFTKLCHFVPFFKKFLLIWILSEKWKWKVPFLSEI